MWWWLNSGRITVQYNGDYTYVYKYHEKVRFCFWYFGKLGLLVVGEGLWGLTLVGSSYITMSAVMATTCTLGNRWHWPRQLGCCPRIFVQGLVLFPPWSLAHCSQHGDQLSDGAQLVSLVMNIHMLHIPRLSSVCCLLQIWAGARLRECLLPNTAWLWTSYRASEIVSAAPRRGRPEPEQ